MKNVLKLKNSLSISLIVLLLSVFAVSLSCTKQSTKNGSVYYVSLKGNDTNNGSSKAPFRTIKKGASILSAGDTLIVKSGNYGHEYDINVVKSGTKEFPIVIMAEKPGSVFLVGLREPGAEDYVGEGGIAFGVLNSSNVVIDGFNVSEYAVGVNVLGKADNQNGNARNVIVKRCIFKDNGEAGVQTSRVDSSLVSNCQFISDKVQKDGYLVAVQDYGCNFFNTNYSTVDGCYFFGAHHQSISFKEGCKNGLIRRNILEGAQYTAIYLGQNRRADITPENDNPICENIIAEYNMVRAAKGFRVKSPLRVDNCKNAIVRFNYFEGFDETNNTGGINVWNEAMGKIEIYDNILAFGVGNEFSAGISLELGGSSDADILIHNNTIYSVVQDLKLDRYRGDDTVGYEFKNNISYKCKYNPASLKENFRGNPKFINGDPTQQPIAIVPAKPDFDTYYTKFTQPFRLQKNSSAKGFGVRFK